MAELTPLMKQYQSVKEKHPDAVLFFRLGDFYEMFGEDAKLASRILQIALTSRDRGKEEPTPMCGIPYFAAESYIAKLISAGHKVAICEQMEDPAEAKGVVRREVVRVITPGTKNPDSPKENNFIACLFPAGRRHGIAAADLSTGEFVLFETENPPEDELEKFEPREVVYPASLGQDLHYKEALKNFFTSPVDDFLFDHPEAYKTLLAHFRVSSLEAFGCEGLPAAVSAAGALLATLKETQKEALSFEKLTAVRAGDYMFMDAATRKNLELVRNLKDGGREGTLLWALDETLTPMGGRYLRNAVLKPMLVLEQINAALDAVRRITENYELMEGLRAVLRKIQDIERLSARLQMGTANPRDVIALKNSLKSIPALKKSLSSEEEGKEGNALLAGISEGLGDFQGQITLIERSIKEHPPLALRDGGIIRDGYDSEADELRSICLSSRDYITRLEAEERKKTGIGSLKVGYTRIFGYFIEVTRPNLPQVPERYIRKQTLVNAERFITPELKEYEARALGAEEKLKALEFELFQSVAGELKKAGPELSLASRKIAELDYLVSLALVARRHDYSMPQVNGSLSLEIVNGRHPVIERLQMGEKFIPNGLVLDEEKRRMLIITGPNMAGKSTYMRQNALIVLMAQMGSFVPAEKAVMGLVDRVFTRIGASDYLTMGQSTFMVEMLETSNIIHNATRKSLIILDEVGRGTSTFDGISIAWAAAEHIARKIQARTLFATHYHELTELGISLEGVGNCNVAVREWGEEIIFLRRIEEGVSDKSYGIQVARLAGLPESIVARARAVLSSLESQILSSGGMPRFLPESGTRRAGQLDLFGGASGERLAGLLRDIPEDITPQDALKKLIELKRKASSDS